MAHASADFTVGAYWPGAKFVEYLASSNYSTCQNVPAKSPDEARRIQFDGQDNLWTFGNNSASLEMAQMICPRTEGLPALALNGSSLLPRSAYLTLPVSATATFPLFEP